MKLHLDQCTKDSGSWGVETQQQGVVDRNGGEHDIQRVEKIAVLTFGMIGEPQIAENSEGLTSEP